ncbi:MAG: FtsW/RodA/SpoVE family cell cycle protein, partial [Bacteroidales bacterium]|nr:FtsW/RodA/SpoVE family cell cycle protein [Bacteroidales bacterium]
MGCWFCWNCPMDWLYGEGQHSVFMRQVVWNAMGLVLFAGASMVRWKWWQKSAPWLLVVWALLAFYAVFFCRPINGSYRWVSIGFLRINVRTLFILVSALFAAWLCSKKHVRPWMIIAVVG